MTLSAVGSVFSSSDHHQNNPPSSPNHRNNNNNNNNTLQYQLQTPTHKNHQISPPSTISSVGGIHENDNSLTTDLSFTPPHPYTQLNILSSKNNNNNKTSNENNPNQLKIQQHKVSEKLHELSFSLEHLIENIVTTNKNDNKNENINESESNERQEVKKLIDKDISVERIKDHLLPEIVSRLRYLSGVLDGTVDISEYEETFGSETIFEKNVKQENSPVVDDDKKDNIEDKKDNIEDNDIFGSPSSTQSPVRNTSRLITSQFDSDDSLLSLSPSVPVSTLPSSSSSLSSSTTKPPQSNSKNMSSLNTSNDPMIKLNDWGMGRESNEKEVILTDEMDEETLSNISPIQILYSKPSSYTSSTLPPPPSSTTSTTTTTQSNRGGSKKKLVTSNPSDHPL